MGGLLHLDSEEGTGRAVASPSPLLAVPNVTAHPSTASVSITVLLYDGPLLCSFNVAIKGLRFDEPKSLHFFVNSKINKEVWQNQRWVADDVSDDALQWMLNLSSGLRPKLSRLVSVFGLSKRLIQKVKWPNMPVELDNFRLET